MISVFQVRPVLQSGGVLPLQHVQPSLLRWRGETAGLRQYPSSFTSSWVTAPCFSAGCLWRPECLHQRGRGKGGDGGRPSIRGPGEASGQQFLTDITEMAGEAQVWSASFPLKTLPICLGDEAGIKQFSCLTKLILQWHKKVFDCQWLGKFSCLKKWGF